AMFSTPLQPIDQYRHVGTVTAVSQADPHQLVMLLFDGAIAAVLQARHAIETRDTATKVATISKAMKIIDEGLKASLESHGAGDWDSVCRLEGACAVVIARLRLLGRDQPLAADEQRERMRILRLIVERDAEIRRLCEPASSLADPAGWPLVEAGTTIH